MITILPVLILKGLPESLMKNYFSPEIIMSYILSYSGYALEPLYTSQDLIVSLIVNVAPLVLGVLLFLRRG